MADHNSDPLLDDTDDGDELTTAAEVIKKLEEVWINEKLSPELLTYEGEIVECLLDQLQHMESSLQKIQKDDFRIVFHRMELDRIRYLLSSYLRVRLEKIEKFGAHLLHQISEGLADGNIMSDEEKLFAHKYSSSIKNYLHDAALKNMPVNMQALKLEEVGFKPQLDNSVFIKVKKECKGVIIENYTDYGEDEIVDLDLGSQHILRYQPIASLLKDGSIQLI